MNEIIRTLVKMNGYRMGAHKINILCYADDAVLFAECEDDLQRLLFQFYTASKRKNMEISINKTKCMTIAKDPLRCKLAIENKPIEQVMQLKYLGTTITSSGMSLQEVKDQVTKANRIAGCLNHAIWYNKYLRQESKLRIYKSVVRPILSYSAETRSDSVKTRQQLETSEMRVLRKIANKTLRDRERNEHIRLICKIEPVSEWVLSRRREWDAHVDRMRDDRIVKIVRDNRPAGRRAVGRPRTRWKDSI